MKFFYFLSLLSLFACTNSEVENTQSYTYQEVFFPSNDARLSGGLWLPVSAGPHPAMVIAHGSGRSTKDNARGMAEHFVQKGFAILTYDKRGVGDSEGTYVGKNNTSRRNLLLLAQDVSLGISYLKSLPVIDAGQIGIYGWSQAGWILPIVAAQRYVKFSILISGPTVTTGEENYYSDLTGDGSTREFDQKEISRKLAEKGPSGFDPYPYLEKMNATGLWLLGGADRSIPIPESVAVLDRLIDDEQKPFYYHVFQDANHGLRVNGQLVDSYWKIQEDFLFNTVKIVVSK